MKIDGPKFNNFTNLDSENLESLDKKSNKLGGNPIGLEVNQLSNTEQGKGKFNGSLGSEGSDRPINLGNSNLGRPMDDLLGGDLLKLPPGLQKKLSDDFPKSSTNGSSPSQGSNTFPTNSNRPVTDNPTNSSPANSPDLLKSQFQGSLFNRGNDVANNARAFPSPINRPNANDLSVPNNKGNKVKSGAFPIPKELSTSVNQPLQETSKAENLFNQKNDFKDTFKSDNRPDNKPDKGTDKPVPGRGKPIETSPNVPPSEVEEVENTLEIEITQSMQVPSDRTDEFPVESDIDLGNIDGGDFNDFPGNGRMGKGRGKDVEFGQTVNNNNSNIQLDENISLQEPLTDLETVAANVISRLANKDLSQTVPLSQFSENPLVENLAPEDLAANQNNFASTLQLGSGNFSSDQLEVINSALDDINNLVGKAFLDKAAQTNANVENKINIPELIASSNTKNLTVPVGQSLEQVANELGIDVFDLLKANPQLLKDPLLFAGQKVRIPNPQDLTTLQSNNLASTNSLVNEALDGKLGKGLSQLPLEQTKAGLGNISPLSTKPELTKAALENELNVNAASIKSDKGIARTPQERGIEPSSAKPEIKHTEPLVPGFGIFANKEIEIELNDDRPQSRRKYNLPEPFDEWADHIYNAADKYNLDASLIASLIWCESAGKNIVGKNGHGYGLMQIDDRRHKAWLKANEDGLNPASNIDFGVSVLRKNIDYFKGKISAGIAAYDCGIDLVEESLIVGKDVDFFTTDRNYSFRVLAQQDYFRKFFD
jgi:LysM repeat protein